MFSTFDILQAERAGLADHFVAAALARLIRICPGCRDLMAAEALKLAAAPPTATERECVALPHSGKIAPPDTWILGIPYMVARLLRGRPEDKRLIVVEEAMRAASESPTQLEDFLSVYEGQSVPISGAQGATKGHQ